VTEPTTSRSAWTSPAVPHTVGWGIALAVVTACISGLAVWLNAYGVRQVPDAAVYTTLKNGVAAVVLFIAAAALVRPSDLREVKRSGWISLIAIGLVGGGFAFLLFFSGLAASSGPSAAFIQKTMFVWVAILAIPLLGERLGLVQLAALAVLVVGQALIQSPAGIVWGSGESMILVATLCWAAEVVVVRRFLREMATPIIAVGRLGIGLVALVGFIVVTGRAGAILTLGLDAWGWILLTGIVLAGYVTAWFGALRRAPATVVTSVLVGAAVITGVLQAVAKGGAPTIDVVAGYLLIAGAVGLIAWLAARARTLGRPAQAGTTSRAIDA
jgi:drug/metabolite transporter (DMT)-like permease